MDKTLILFLILSAFISAVSSEYNETLDAIWNNTKNKAEFFKYFNSQNFSWKGKYNNNNRQYFGIALDADFGPSKSLPHENCTINPSDLPVNFDAREKWNKCPTIGMIRDQNPCGTCWAFASSNIISDRYCIHKNINVDISQQDLQCCKKCWNHTDIEMCHSSGNIYSSLEYWATTGIVSTKCKPYNPEKLKNTNCSYVCDNQEIDYKKDLYTGLKGNYELPADDYEIKCELFSNGPVATYFNFYSDFEYYSKGVYEHLFGVQNGTHAVRVIGFGVENGIDYWLVANTWNKSWGDNGLFKVKKFDEGLDFENHFQYVLP